MTARASSLLVVRAGANGGVNIDSGAAVDPETGIHLRRRADRHELDRARRRIRVPNSVTARRMTVAGCIGALPTPPGYTPAAGGGATGGLATAAAAPLERRAKPQPSGCRRGPRAAAVAGRPR